MGQVSSLLSYKLTPTFYDLIQELCRMTLKWCPHWGTNYSNGLRLINEGLTRGFKMVLLHQCVDGEKIDHKQEYICVINKEPIEIQDDVKQLFPYLSASAQKASSTKDGRGQKARYDLQCRTRYSGCPDPITMQCTPTVVQGADIPRDEFNIIRKDLRATLRSVWTKVSSIMKLPNGDRAKICTKALRTLLETSNDQDFAFAEGLSVAITSISITNVNEEQYTFSPHRDELNDSRPNWDVVAVLSFMFIALGIMHRVSIIGYTRHDCGKHMDDRQKIASCIANTSLISTNSNECSPSKSMIITQQSLPQSNQDQPKPNQLVRVDDHHTFWSRIEHLVHHWDDECSNGILPNEMEALLKVRECGTYIC